MLHTSDFDFDLPTELIASHPLARRDASRMLVVRNSPPLEGCRECDGVVRDSVNYRTLPFNSELKEKARALRHAGSLPEVLLWKEIKNHQLNGLDFDRQKVIGNYIVDFFCASKFVVIEIDDKATHDLKAESDAARDEYMRGLNLTVIRIPAADVLKDAHAVYLWLSNHPALQAPLQRRGTCVDLSDRHIRDFLDYIQAGDVVVFNNSRVIPARFDATDAAGHEYEITLHTAAGGNLWWGLCKKFTRIAIGDMLTMTDGTQIRVVDSDADSGLKLEFLCDDVLAVLNKIGKMPLPPYMHRNQEDSDRERYQTVYADPIGSMAAPTAGLHFTPELMDEIARRGATIVKVTLHVGAGTWMPVKTEDLSQHKMHSEWCQITPAQADIINNAKRVIAVGTTSMRTLESAAIRNRALPESERQRRVVPFCDTTDIFITPGYTFGAVDVLLTNFHLPKSTLFMLVSAFAGLDEMRAAYAHAVAEKYRFFSYGDCCLLFKKDAQ